uniref:Toll-like receptor 13 n=1 Tax=Xiphophorus maculatus TaxID=8083 RepID=A0A3B5Q0H1_XIPMA
TELDFMATKGNLSSLLILRLFLLLLHFNPSLLYFLKNCTILYQENPSADVYVDCKERKLLAIPDDIPKDAVSLEFGKNELLKLKQHHFHGLFKLRILEIRSNKIASAENGSFLDLALLNTLNMGWNKLTNITADMFQGLSNLTQLELSFNRIQFIHKTAFNFLVSLQTVELSGNKIQQITEIQPILQLPQIQKLKLLDNSLSSFETKDLQLNFSSSLKELHVSGDNMQMFSITTPILPHLQLIELLRSIQSSKIIWYISDKHFLRNITHLYLGWRVLLFKNIKTLMKSLNSLSYLSLDATSRWIERGLLSTVCNIPTLRSLDLTCSDLRNLTFELASCSQLLELDLSFGQMAELRKGSIQSINRLQSLNVTNNKLTIVPHDIRNLAFLEVLNMQNNTILTLTCEDFVNTTSLRELYLNGNRITDIKSCVIEKLPNLMVLDLSYNLLMTFGDSFDIPLHKLEVLDVIQNPIKMLDVNKFQQLQSLKMLNVETQLLNNLPVCNDLQLLDHLTVYLRPRESFKTSVSNYSEIHINAHSLKSLTLIAKDQPTDFDTVKKFLMTLTPAETFTATNIYGDPPDGRTFKFTPQLKSLTLTKTDLLIVKHKMFLPIPHLQTMDLSESEIKSLDFLMLANLTALRYLKLTDSDISVVNETVFQYLPSLTYLDLRNNPFTCECLNAGFIQWVKSNKQTQVFNGHQYECSFPVSKRGTFLLDFDVKTCWEDGSFLYFISSTCLVVLTLLTSFVYNFLRWHLKYTFHLFRAFLYDSRKRKTMNPHQFDAFVSYNVHDEGWVYRKMLPVLEGQQGWRLCLHHRDFQPGKPIIENITDAIYGSRKTICVISRSYLQSEWCSREIQMASFRLFDEQKDVLILLFLEEIPARHLSPYYRMRKLVKKRTYLSWPQAAQHPGVFWQNVQRALQAGDSENTDLLTGPAGC